MGKEIVILIPLPFFKTFQFKPKWNIGLALMKNGNTWQRVVWSSLNDSYLHDKTKGKTLK